MDWLDTGPLPAVGFPTENHSSFLSYPLSPTGGDLDGGDGSTLLGDDDDSSDFNHTRQHRRTASDPGALSQMPILMRGDSDLLQDEMNDLSSAALGMQPVSDMDQDQGPENYDGHGDSSMYDAMTMGIGGDGALGGLIGLSGGGGGSGGSGGRGGGKAKGKAKGGGRGSSNSRRNARGGYRCAKCGQLKKGHVCTYTGPETLDAVVQCKLPPADCPMWEAVELQRRLADALATVATLQQQVTQKQMRSSGSTRGRGT
jgi:hypothetical protein